MHGLAVYVKEGIPFARDISLENSVDSYLCFQLALHHLVSYCFFLCQSPSSSLCTIFDYISSKIGEILSINPSANAFLFGDFNVHHKDWLTYSRELIDLVNSVIVSSDLTQMLTFLLKSPTVTLKSPALLDLFISSKASICSTMAFPPLGSFDHVAVLDFVDFQTNLKQDTLLHCIAYFVLSSHSYSCADWDAFCDHLRDMGGYL